MHELKHGGGKTYVVSPKFAHARKTRSVARKTGKSALRSCLKDLREVKYG